MISRCLGYGAVSLIALTAVAPSPAQSPPRTYVDVEAGLGYATNPLLTLGGSTKSGFGRLSAYAYHSWADERGATTISAYVENDSYLHRFSNKQLFNLDASTSRAVSEQVRLYGSLGFSGDFGGQLSSRFYGTPVGATAPDPALPDGYGDRVNPDLYSLNQKRYRLTGQVGGTFALSPRDSLTGSASLAHIFFGRDGAALNYNSYGGTFGYQRRLSEFTSVGVRGIVSRSDYSQGRAVTSGGPQATLDSRISPGWDLSLALGFVRTSRDFGAPGGSDSSTDLALDARLCNELDHSRFCLRASRRTESTVLGTSAASSTLGVDYYRKLNKDDEVQASLGAVRTGRLQTVNVGRQTFYSASGNYSHRFNDRLSTGITLSVRRLAYVGPDPRTDVSGVISLRYRVGDLR